MLQKVIKVFRMPRRALYRIVSIKLKMRIPVWMAKVLAIGNQNRWDRCVKVETYDGSGQACHPSIVHWKNDRILACTPYPYEIEYYENPSLWKSDEQGMWRPINNASPLVLPERIGKEYYSDPCLFVRKDSIYLIFRKCERKDTGKEDVLFITKSPNGFIWEEAIELIRGEGNKFISPGMADEQDRLFCVEYCGSQETCLVVYEFTDETTIRNRQSCVVNGLDKNYYIWHIDIQRCKDGSIKGLFMLKKKNNPEEDSKLVLFWYDESQNEWNCEKDLPLNSEEEANVRYVYKSCFDGEEDSILCSAIDSKGRFILFNKDIGGENE